MPPAWRACRITVLEALAIPQTRSGGSLGGNTQRCSADGVEGFSWDLDDPLQAARHLIRLLEDEGFVRANGRGGVRPL